MLHPCIHQHIAGAGIEGDQAVIRADQRDIGDAADIDHGRGPRQAGARAHQCPVKDRNERRPLTGGRDVRGAVFAKDARADEARAAGAEHVGAEDLYERIAGGFMEFDRVIASPDMMALVGRLGKVLGPRGLMPNPKVGTVTMDVKGAVAGAKGGSVEFRVEAAGILQAGVGKASFAADKLVENIRAFTDAVNKAKPSGAKGHYVNRVSISSTMGPGIKVDMATLAPAAAEK